jgi:hypothetical protein
VLQKKYVFDRVYLIILPDKAAWNLIDHYEDNLFISMLPCFPVGGFKRAEGEDYVL